MFITHHSLDQTFKKHVLFVNMHNGELKMPEFQIKNKETTVLNVKIRITFFSLD